MIKPSLVLPPEEDLEGVHAPFGTHVQLVQDAIGRRAARLRIALKLSRADFAAKCCLHIKTLHAIEHGKANPTLETLAKIAAVAEWSVGTLVGARDPAPPDPVLSLFEFEKCHLAYVLKFRRPRDQGSQKLLALASKVNVNTIAAIEHRTANPSVEILARLALDGLGHPFNVLFGDPPEPEDYPGFDENFLKWHK